MGGDTQTYDTSQVEEYNTVKLQIKSNQNEINECPFSSIICKAALSVCTF